MFEYKYTRKLCFGICTTAVIAFGSSISFALLISLDRLIAVSSQECRVKHMLRGKRRYAVIAIPPLFIGVVTLVFIYSYPNTGCFFNCEVTVMFSLQNGRIPIVMEAQLIVTLPVLLIAGLYSLIIIRLRKHIRMVGVQVMSFPTSKTRQLSMQATAIGKTNMPATPIRGKRSNPFTAIGNTDTPGRPIETTNRGHALVPGNIIVEWTSVLGNIHLT